MQKRIHAIFRGRVQGVGFRFTAESAATSLGISGWIKNLASGDVELVAESKEESLKDFLSRLDAAFSGYIAGKDISWEEATGEFKDFDVRF